MTDHSRLSSGAGLCAGPHSRYEVAPAESTPASTMPEQSFIPNDSWVLAAGRGALDFRRRECLAVGSYGEECIYCGPAAAPGGY